MPAVKRGGRIRGKYTKNERTIIDPFKDQYKQATLPSERQHIAMNIIFKQLFFYWTQNDGTIDAEDAKVRGENLVYWLQNNWRRPRKHKKPTTLVIKRSNIVYKLKRKAVWDEIAVILGVEHADTTTENWFPTRPIAIRNIMERMTPAEHREIDEAVAKIEQEGYSLDEKQINATKHCTQRFQDTAKQQWMEMGVLSFSIVAYRNKSNQLAVEIHERSCSVTGVQMKEEFQDRHRDKLREIQRLWLDYVRELLDKHEGKQPQAHTHTLGAGFNTQAQISPAATSEETSLRLGYSDDGFPRLPVGLDLDKMNKKNGCALLRSYLAQNYLLGTFRQSDQVPYRSMMESASTQAQYIDPKYLPTNFRLADPQNMKLSLIRDFFCHVKAREIEQPPSQVFRFRRANSTRRKGEIMETLYPDEIDPQNPPVVKKRASKPRKKATTNPGDSTGQGPAGLVPTDAGQLTLHNLSLGNITAPTRTPAQPHADDLLAFLKYSPHEQNVHNAGHDPSIAAFVPPVIPLPNETGERDAMVDASHWPGYPQRETPGTIDETNQLLYHKMHNDALEHMYSFDSGCLNIPQAGDHSENYLTPLRARMPEPDAQPFNPFLTPPPDPVYKVNDNFFADPGRNRWNRAFLPNDMLPNPPINFDSTWDNTQQAGQQNDQTLSNPQITGHDIRDNMLHNPGEGSNLTQNRRHDRTGRPLPVLKLKSKEQAVAAQNPPPGVIPGPAVISPNPPTGMAPAVVAHNPPTGVIPGPAVVAQNPPTGVIPGPAVISPNPTTGAPMAPAVVTQNPPTTLAPGLNDNDPATAATNLGEAETRPRRTADALAKAEAGTLVTGKRKRLLVVR